jgi:hypothetical protein
MDDHREMERQRQRQQILNVKFTRIKREYEEYRSNIAMTIEQMEICFKIVVPDLSAPEEDSWKNLDDQEILDTVDTTTDSLTIELPNSFQELKNKDNVEIFEILSDGLTEIRLNFLPMVKEWCRVCVEVVVDGSSVDQKKILKDGIKLKSHMISCVEKCEKLKIESKESVKRKMIEKPKPSKKFKEIQLI